MDAKLELEGYEVQIKEIDEALKTDAGNTELLELKAELETLVDLLRKSIGGSASGSASAGPSTSTSQSASTSSNKQSYASTSSSSSKFTTGTAVLAKWKKDGKFYPARIASVSGSTTDPAYTVIFDIDKSTEVVRSGDIKVLTESKKRAFAAVNGDSDEGSGSEKKGKGRAAAAAAKTEKKAVKEEERKARVAQQNKAQSTWQSFAKKGAKKGYHIPGVTGESQFRSPDNPYGRVGVVGSGKGMTNYEQKKRAKFEEAAEE